MDKEQVKNLAIGALVTACAGLLWNTFGRGVEATIADNPAFAEMRAELIAHEQELTSHITQFENLNTELRSAIARGEARDEALIRNQDRIYNAITGQ